MPTQNDGSPSELQAELSVENLRSRSLRVQGFSDGVIEIMLNLEEILQINNMTTLIFPDKMATSNFISKRKTLVSIFFNNLRISRELTYLVNRRFCKLIS